MAIDFNKVKPPTSVPRPIDPVELFRKARIQDPEVKDLWLGQGDALREWHKARKKNDIAIVLNTGAGKTLIALLAAQSLVNETSGRVLYVCTTNQLIEQTTAKAKGYGLDVTTYYAGKFSDDRFQQGLSPCVTNYAAVFNGRSKFLHQEISALIFDDAHAAEHLIRESFTVTISSKEFPKQFDELRLLFRPFFSKIGSEFSYDETFKRPEHRRDWIVPPFAVHEALKSFQEILASVDFSESASGFAWEHLKDKTDLCAVLLSGYAFVITPAFLPVRTLPYFAPTVRRLYLSATIAANDTFVRSFGRRPDETIAPPTNAGECERLIIIPGLNKSCGPDIEITKKAIDKRKTLILVPSGLRADTWKDIVQPLDTMRISAGLNKFKASRGKEKFVLVGRYDGVDLPGDACRVMVIDDLPSAVGPLERFMWERLGLGITLRSTVASRIVQSFGRISRGLTDHGVVFITGKRLVDWLISPQNSAALPVFLQRQLILGKTLATEVSCSDLLSGADQCLRRDEGWIRYYEGSMKSIADLELPRSDDSLVEIAIREAEYAAFLWDRRYDRAARSVEAGLDSTFKSSRATGAWHSLWLGFAYQLMGDLQTAREHYRSAHNVAKNIPPFELGSAVKTSIAVPPQAKEVARSLLLPVGVRKSLPPTFDKDLKYLDGSGSPPQTEEAIKILGEYLGLQSSRPDDEFGTGPDDLWTTPEAPAFALELKTGKLNGKQYGKKDIYQWPDHIQWVKDNTEFKDIRAAFIGPLYPASAQANPAPDMQVIELSEFARIANRLRAAIQEICANALPITIEDVAFESLKKHDVIWPDFYDTLQKHTLKQIK